MSNFYAVIELRDGNTVCSPEEGIIAAESMAQAILETGQRNETVNKLLGLEYVVALVIDGDNDNEQ